MSKWPNMSEKDFQSLVVQTARLSGWITYHTFDSRRSNPGFPDLVLVRGERLIFAELKTDKGKLKPEQETWLKALRRASVEVYVWRPKDFEGIKWVLARATGERKTAQKNAAAFRAKAAADREGH